MTLVLFLLLPLRRYILALVNLVVQPVCKESVVEVKLVVVVLAVDPINSILR